MSEFSDVFPKQLPQRCPRGREVDHRIDLVPQTQPVHTPPYQMSKLKADVVAKQLNVYLKLGSYLPPLVELVYF